MNSDQKDQDRAATNISQNSDTIQEGIFFSQDGEATTSPNSSSGFWTQFSSWSNCAITSSLMHRGPKHFSYEANVVKKRL